MSVDDLLAALERNRQQQLEEIRRQAAERESGLRAAAAAEIAGLRARHAEELSLRNDNRRRQESRRLLREQRALLLAAEEELAERVGELAQKLLVELRLREDYPASFEKLCLELPAAAWEGVFVHPDDIDLARRFLAGAKPHPERGITGGLRAWGGAGSIEVDNTLDRRLARSLPTLVPGIIRELCEGAEDGASFQNTAAE